MLDLGVLLRLLGPRAVAPVEPFGCGAPWTGHATEDELQRLAVLQARIQRREAALRDLVAQRQLIMHRCIRRMRRQNGKG